MKLVILSRHSRQHLVVGDAPSLLRDEPESGARGEPHSSHTPRRPQLRRNCAFRWKRACLGRALVQPVARRRLSPWASIDFEFKSRPGHHVRPASRRSYGRGFLICPCSCPCGALGRAVDFGNGYVSAPFESRAASFSNARSSAGTDGHDCWDAAFQSEEVTSWLFAQRRARRD